MINTNDCDLPMPPYSSAQYSALTVPLDESLPGVSSGLPLPAGVEKNPSAKVSTLKNGLKVASIETFSPVSSVGLVVGKYLSLAATWPDPPLA